MEKPKIILDTIVIDCSADEVKPMMDFYTKLAGLVPDPNAGDDMPTLVGSHIAISLFPVKSHVRPTFPSPEVGRQIHLDFFVEDLDAAVKYARSIGAIDSSRQFHDSYRIMLDPAGHPFCLTTNGPAAGSLPLD